MMAERIEALEKEMDCTTLNENRRFDRVKTTVKVRLSGDAVWTESPDADVSGCGLLFDTVKRLSNGDLNTVQFMLQSRSGSSGNMLFFANAKVIRTAPRKDLFRTAVELIIDDTVRPELLRMLRIIKCQNIRGSVTST